MRRLLWLFVWCVACPATAAEADRDKNGFTTYEELSNYYYSYLTQLDKDHDLGLTPPEISGLYGSYVANGAFANADLDSDGVLRGDERSAFARAIAADDLAYCDRDYDHAIGADEDEYCF